MSAIFGILDLEGRAIDPAWVSSMQDDLAHRGPDGKGLYQEESIVMGHMLLQVTPESIYDRSPYEEDGFVITAHARLDEREALMDRLNIAAAERDTITDPLLLLRSYIQFGKDFVKDIYGDFAFAIWDKQKKELFCARDQIGVKPFLYYFQEGRFVFSSELRSIVKLPCVKTDLDYYALRDKAIGIAIQPEVTDWKHIVRLKPASLIFISNQNLESTRYWTPKYKRNKSFKTENDSASKLKDVLIKVIADHTKVIGGVGVPLSGGLDSSTIACLAARKLSTEGKRVTTASSVYQPGFNNDGASDEMEYVKEVIKQEKNIDPEFVYHSDLSLVNDLNNQYNLQYAPVNSFYYVDEALYQKFNAKTIRRVMSGVIGDLTVSNTVIKPLPVLLLTGRFIALKKLFPKLLLNSGQSLSGFIKSRFILEIAPKYLLYKWNKYKGRTDNSWRISMHPLLLNKKEVSIMQKKLQVTLAPTVMHSKNIEENIWPKYRDFFREDWDCRTSHHHIEMTYPLCDRRIIELLLQIPVEHFYAEGVKRGLIRQAMDGILPGKIRTRKKKGYYAPGYPALFKKELRQLNKFDEGIPLLAGISKLIDIKRFKCELRNLSDSSNDSSFTYRWWSLVKLSICIDFVRWFFENKKMKL